MGSAAVEDRLERGVYTAPYLVRGRRVVFCVDSAGNARKHYKIWPRDQAAAVRALEELLDMIDPPPRIRLLRPDPAGPGWPYDGSEMPQRLGRMRLR